MEDYRGNPQDSPKVWCTQCKQLVPATKNHVKMRTVFAITPSGVYPYAIYSQSVVSASCTKKL